MTLPVPLPLCAGYSTLTCHGFMVQSYRVHLQKWKGAEKKAGISEEEGNIPKLRDIEKTPLGYPEMRDDR